MRVSELAIHEVWKALGVMVTRLLRTAITGNISRIGNPPHTLITLKLLFHMSLLPSSSLKVIKETLHKTSLPAESYVLSLTSIAGQYAASASSPSNQIRLFDKATLQCTGVLKGHEHATTQLCTAHHLGTSTREMLLSSGKDGCVIVWDERSGSAGIKSGLTTSLSPEACTLTTQRMFLITVETSGRLRPLLCCDASDDGFLVVAGTDLQKEDAFIIYWLALY